MKLGIMIHLANNKKYMSYLEYHLKNGLEIVNNIPAGWKVLENSTTAPVGYILIYNGESLFSGKRKLALLKL